MKKEYIFFDLDGTLTDSMPGITRAVQYALKHYGIVEEDLDALKPFVGPPLPDSFKEYYHFTQRDADDSVAVFREYYNIKGWMENAAYAGIGEALRELKENGKKLYVATSKPEDMARRVLDHFHLTDFFEFIGAANEDSSRVNKDDVIRYVIDSCGLTDLDRIVMVGDRKHDIAGAHKTGVEALGVLYGYGSREELEGSGADWIAEDVKEMKQLLLRL